MYSNFSMALIPRYYSQVHQNKQTTHEKQNLSKTEQSVAICNFLILMCLQNFWNKFVDVSNLSINLLQKPKNILLQKMTAILVSAKVSIFYSKIALTSPKSSQRLYLEQTLI